MRESTTNFIQKAVVANNHGNSTIWACQVVLIGPSPHLALSQPLCGGRKAEGTWTPVGCEAAQLCEAKEVLHGTSVPSASRLWNGPCPEDQGHFSSGSRGGRWLHHSGMFTAIQASKDGLSKSYVREQVLGGIKKPILMSWALLDELKGLHSSFAWCC